MASSEPKAFTWRMSEIPSDCTKEEILGFFPAEDRDRVRVESLCPDVEWEGFNVATVLFRPRSDRTKEEPRLDPGNAHGVNIDKTFYDFTPLYHPPDDTIITADIIAVTGLAGHAFGSWAHANGKMWLRDYLPAVAPSARIMTYGYSNPISGDTTSCSTIEDLSETFLNNLMAVRDSGKCEQRPIIFIGHSLGGLIIKKAMIDAWFGSMRNDRNRLPVRSIIFLGVPHNGMDTEALQTLVGDKPPEALLRELRPGSLTLRRLNKDFKKIASDASICTLWESLTTKTVVLDQSTNEWSRSGPDIIMVPEHSARLDLPRERVSLADANHSTIAKVERSQRTIWRILSSTIKTGLAAAMNDGSEEAQQQQQQQPIVGLIRDAADIAAVTPDSDSYGSSLLGDGSAAHRDDTTGAQSIAGNRGTTVAASRAADSSPMDVSSDAVPRTGEAMACGCISSRSGFVYCAKCSAILQSLDCVWVCSECTIFQAVCVPCHVQWSNNGKCAMHPNTSTKKRTLFDSGKYFRAVKEEEISTGDSTTSLVLQHNVLPAIKSLFQSVNVNLELNRLGQRPLHFAAQRHRAGALEILLQCKDVHIDAQDTYGFTPLAAAVSSKSTCIVEMLLKSGADFDTLVDEKGDTPLHFACYVGSVAIVRLLISEYSKRGLKTIDKFNSAGQTALFDASQRACWEVADILLQAGADPLAEAPNEGKVKTIKEEPPGHQIGKLAAAGNVDAVRFLLSACGNSSVECLDSSSRSPLWQAAVHGHGSMCRTLLEMGADPNAVPSDQRYPALYMAAKYDYIDVVKALLNDGRTNVEATDPDGLTALLVATLKNRSEVVNMLLERGAATEMELVAVPTTGNTERSKATAVRGNSLCIAASNGSTGICRNLLDHGAAANVELVYRFGSKGKKRVSTPLGCAAKSGSLSICKMLVEAGAAVDAIFEVYDESHDTLCDWRPLHIAAYLGHADIVSYLLAQGAVAQPPPEYNGRWRKFQFFDKVPQSTRRTILGLVQSQKYR